MNPGPSVCKTDVIPLHHKPFSLITVKIQLFNKFFHIERSIYRIIFSFKILIICENHKNIKKVSENQNPSQFIYLIDLLFVFWFIEFWEYVKKWCIGLLWVLLICKSESIFYRKRLYYKLYGYCEGHVQFDNLLILD